MTQTQVPTSRAMPGIALIALTTLLFELVVQKALSFSTWGSLGYMIIGLAIFGYSLAGVGIAIWRPHKKYDPRRLLSGASALLGMGILLAYAVMNIVPFNFEALPQQPVMQVVYFGIWYLSLLIPFTMSGFVIALLLLLNARTSNRLYAADLAGAGLGCAIVAPLFPVLAPSGQYCLAAALAFVCAGIFAPAGARRGARVVWVLALTCLLMAPFAEDVFPIRAHQHKRGRYEDLVAGNIKSQQWSFLSKVEVATRQGRSTGMIWFDGGLMQSAIDRFDGDYAAERESGSLRGANTVAYRIRPCEEALVIASSGGREVRAALTWGANNVTAVELDWSVVKLVRDEMNTYLGGLYRDPRVKLVNDEGRSFVARSDRKFDVIQFISAYSVTAVQSGAVDLAASYLVTGEAFDEYLGHLSSTGFLHISCDNALRLFFSGWEALRRQGLEPGGRILLLRNDDSTLGRNTLLLSMDPYSTEELEKVGAICRDAGILVNYAPAAFWKSPRAAAGIRSEQTLRDVVEKFVATPNEEHRAFYDDFPYRVRPTSDDKPYYNDMRYLGRPVTEKPAYVTEEIEELLTKTWYVKGLPLGKLAKLVVLGFAGVLALIALFAPLLRFRSDGLRTQWQLYAIAYFFCLGIGFIWVEIVLLKQFILFLGNPVYSISAILAAMLLAAGAGSFATEWLPADPRRRIRIIVPAIIGVTLLIVLGFPPILQSALHLSLWARIGLSVVLISPVGFVLGMPFATGLSVLAERGEETIPWAWAANGYATVVGVSLTPLVASRTGFGLLILIASGIYMLGFFALSRSIRASDR